MYIDIAKWWFSPLIVMCISYILIIGSGIMYEPKDREFKVCSRIKTLCLDGYINTYYRILGFLMVMTVLLELFTGIVWCVQLVQYCLIGLSMVWVVKLVTKTVKNTYNFLKENV